KHQTPDRLFLPLNDDENAQCERKRGEDLAVRTERVTWPVGMDEHGIANSTPRPRRVARHSGTDSAHNEGRGYDDKYCKQVNRKEVVSPGYPENASVNVIHARRLRIHRRMVDHATVQDVVCNRTVIALVAIVQRRPER